MEACFSEQHVYHSKVLSSASLISFRKGERAFITSFFFFNKTNLLWPFAFNNYCVCHLKDSIWFFLMKAKVYLQMFLRPDKLYFSLPLSLMEGLEINGPLSTLPSTVLYRSENFFFCKLDTNYSMSYKIVGPKKTWFDIILSLSVLFPAWPKGVSGNRHKTLSFFLCDSFLKQVYNICHVTEWQFGEKKVI